MLGLVIILAVIMVCTGFCFWAFLMSGDIGGILTCGFALYGLGHAISYCYELALV